MDSIPYVRKDRRFIPGMPNSFTRYRLSEGADHLSDDQPDMMEDPFHA